VANTPSPADAFSHAARRPIAASSGVRPARNARPSIHSAAPSAGTRSRRVGDPDRSAASSRSSRANASTSAAWTAPARRRAACSSRPIFSASCSDTVWANSSHAARSSWGRRRGVRWWQAIRPHSRPSSTSDSDIDAATPMFAMYSRCSGDTDRSAAWVRSSGRPVVGFTGGTIGAGT